MNASVLWESAIHLVITSNSKKVWWQTGNGVPYGGATGANEEGKRKARAAPRGKEIEQNATDATRAT